MNKKLRFIVRLPLIGLNAWWVTFMFAIYVANQENRGSVANAPDFKLAPYLYLLGIGLLAVSSVVAHALADNERLSKDTEATRSLFRFASLAVIVSLVAGAVYAFATFLGSFGYAGANASIMSRLLQVYLPIVLATALVVVVLLRATVFRKSSAHERGESGKMAPAQKALIFGYVSPVVGTAIAIILGLVFYDAQGRTLDIWAWVVIQAIIGASVVLGTRFASAAKAGKPVVKPAKKTVAGAVGAVNLNLVLTVIFGAAVTLMAFAMGSDAVSQLNNNGYYLDGEWVNGSSVPTWKWFMDKMLPAYLLLLSASLGVCLSTISRLGIGRKNDK